jgi:hypothetical protein
MNTLGGILRAQAQDLQAIQALPALPPDDFDDEILTGKITDTFRNNNSFEEFCGYSEGVITSIAELVTPLTFLARTRGPLPKSSVSDMIICYLLQYRVDATAAQLAKIVNISEGRFSKNVDRVRPHLLAALKQRWATMFPRPDTDLTRDHNYAAHLIDVTTIECFRPEGRFEEAKHYFDAKNHIYGVKSEVAVTAVRTHYYVHSTPHEPGSVHDYTIHKRNYRSYLDYLHKTPDERTRIQDPDPNEDYWAAIMDKAYVGPRADTPEMRRITPMKKPVTAAQRASNLIINKERVPNEQFFGRLGAKFVVYRRVYKFDHRHFDSDFAIACYLTNEDILLTALAEADSKAYSGVHTKRQQDFDAERDREKASRLRYKANRAARLETIGSAVPGPKKD